MLLITSSRTSSKWLKTIPNGRFIVIFHILCQLFYLVGCENFSCILLKFVLYAANNQFSDKFNNGAGLLASVVLFQMILTFKRMIIVWGLFPSPTGQLAKTFGVTVLGVYFQFQTVIQFSVFGNYWMDCHQILYQWSWKAYPFGFTVFWSTVSGVHMTKLCVFDELCTLQTN